VIARRHELAFFFVRTFSSFNSFYIAMLDLDLDFYALLVRFFLPSPPTAEGLRTDSWPHHTAYPPSSAGAVGTFMSLGSVINNGPSVYAETLLTMGTPHVSPFQPLFFYQRHFLYVCTTSRRLMTSLLYLFSPTYSVFSLYLLRLYDV